MADNEQTTAAIAQALADVSEKTQLLVKDEIALAKAEVTGKLKSLGVGAGVAAAAGVFVLIALQLIIIGFGFAIWYWLPFPDQSYFWGFWIEAGVFILVAAGAGFFAYKMIKRGQSPAPTMAIEEAQKIRATFESPDPKSTV